jgi:hypothetical protein
MNARKRQKLLATTIEHQQTFIPHYDTLIYADALDYFRDTPGDGLVCLMGSIFLLNVKNERDTITSLYVFDDSTSRYEILNPPQHCRPPSIIVYPYLHSIP